MKMTPNNFLSSLVAGIYYYLSMDGERIVRVGKIHWEKEKTLARRQQHDARKWRTTSECGVHLLLSNVRFDNE